MMNTDEIAEELERILDDTMVSKGVRELLENSIKLLKSDVATEIKIDKVMETLEELNERSNFPAHLRTQLWSLASELEHKQLIS